VGDFNGDGRQDLAVANRDSDTVSILLSNGGGTFRFPTHFDTEFASPGSVAVGDFNGDGEQDLTVTNIAPASVSILLGEGTGNFSTPMNFRVGDQPGFVAVGDFNGDGQQDLAVANGGSNNVSILLRDCSTAKLHPEPTYSRFPSGTAETNRFVFISPN
jgi:hypothetical protein